MVLNLVFFLKHWFDWKKTLTQIVTFHVRLIKIFFVLQKNVNFMIWFELDRLLNKSKDRSLNRCWILNFWGEKAKKIFYFLFEVEISKGKFHEWWSQKSLKIWHMSSNIKILSSISFRILLKNCFVIIFN